MEVSHTSLIIPCKVPLASHRDWGEGKTYIPEIPECLFFPERSQREFTGPAGAIMQCRSSLQHGRPVYSQIPPVNDHQALKGQEFLHLLKSSQIPRRSGGPVAPVR